MREGGSTSAAEGSWNLPSQGWREHSGVRVSPTGRRQALQLASASGLLPMAGQGAEVNNITLFILIAARIIAYMETYTYTTIYIFPYFFFHIYICMETRCLIKHSFTLYFVGSSLAKGWSARQHPSESLWLCLLSTATRQGHTTRCPLLKPRTGSTLITQCHCSSCLGPAGLLGCCNVTIRMLALDLLICIFHLLI